MHIFFLSSTWEKVVNFISFLFLPRVRHYKKKIKLIKVDKKKMIDMFPEQTAGDRIGCPAQVLTRVPMRQLKKESSGAPTSTSLCNKFLDFD